MISLLGLFLSWVSLGQVEVMDEDHLADLLDPAHPALGLLHRIGDLSEQLLLGGVHGRAVL
jgi:hypothetical protein